MGTHRLPVATWFDSRGATTFYALPDRLAPMRRAVHASEPVTTDA